MRNLPRGSRGLRPFIAPHIFRILKNPVLSISSPDAHTHPIRKIGRGTSPTAQVKKLTLAWHSLLRQLFIFEVKLSPGLLTGTPFPLLLPGRRDTPTLGCSTPAAADWLVSQSCAASLTSMGLSVVTSQRLFAYRSANQHSILWQIVPLCVGQALSLGLSPDTSCRRVCAMNFACVLLGNVHNNWPS